MAVGRLSGQTGLPAPPYRPGYGSPGGGTEDIAQIVFMVGLNTVRSMKKTGYLILLALAAALYACRGECVRCQKSRQPPLNYCENDFPDSHAYHSQINGLDSLGYSCTVK